MSTGGKIARGGRVCVRCEKFFAEGSVCVSALYDAEGDQLWRREDACEACLTAAPRGATPIAVWKVRIEKARRFALSEDAVWQVIKKAMVDAELREKPVTYILCLMLMRKRKLRQTGTRKVKAWEYQKFANISRGVELEVRVPVLHPSAFMNLQNEILGFFEGGE